MTLESAAVAFLRAYVEWSKTKAAMRALTCEYEEAAEYDRVGRVISPNVGPCPIEVDPLPNEDWCANCRTREPLMTERRAALKTYNQARRRALRALKQETP